MSRFLSTLLPLLALSSLVPSVLAQRPITSSTPTIRITDIADVDKRTLGFGSSCNALFAWEAPNGKCVAWGSLGSGDTLPSGKSCPAFWLYQSEVSSCVPTSYLASLFTFWTCPGGFATFDSSDYTCTGSVCAVPKSSSSDCNGNVEFWWSPKKSCCVKGGTSTGAAPTDHSCPTGWSWGGSYCIPSTVSDSNNGSPTCKSSGHNWLSDLFCCATDTFDSDTGSDCSTNSQFWWSGTNGGNLCCTTGGDSSNTGTPPSGSSCPSSSWFWHKTKNCCVPKTPSACSTPTPSCSTSGHSWDAASKCCKGPTPSARRKRAAPTIVAAMRPLGSGPDAARCPSGLTACPIEAVGPRNGTDYECLNPKTELESCGGCRTLGIGQDCTAILGAKAVGCEVGKCKVYSCALGFAPSSTGTSCVRAGAFLAQQRRAPRSLRARI